MYLPGPKTRRNAPRFGCAMKSVSFAAAPPHAWGSLQLSLYAVSSPSRRLRWTFLPGAAGSLFMAPGGLPCRGPTLLLSQGSSGMKFGVGQAVKRLEDQALITGGGRFTDDFKLPNPAHAYILRSPHAHARILRLDTSKAKVARGVLAVLTGADVEADGLGLMPCMIPITSRDGKPRYDTPRPVLAKDRVRHVGDPVALVVAETLMQARDAAEKIEIDYEELPHAVDTYGATQPGAARVWEHI